MNGLNKFFFTSVATGDAKGVEEALARGVDIDIKDEEDGSTALHVAMALHRLEMVPILLAAGCDLEARDGLGLTPLLTAAQSDFSEGISVLLDAGADIKAVCNDGWTSLHWSAWAMSPACVERLIAHGMDVNARTEDGKLAIELTAEDPSVDGELLAVLLLHGADTKGVLIEGMPVAEYARHRGWQHAVEEIEAQALRRSIDKKRENDHDAPLGL